MMPLSTLITNTWLLYNKNFKIYLKLSFWIFLITIPAASLAFLLNAFRQLQAFGVLISLLINLLVFVLTILVTVVLVRIADKQIQSVDSAAPVSIKSEFQRASGVWFEVLLIAILVGLIQLGGFVLLIVPGVIFSIWFAFSLYLVILEKAKIKESLSRSRGLVRGRWWGVFARVLAPSILWSLFGWGVTLIYFNIIDLVNKYFLANVDSITQYIIGLIKVLGSTYISAVFVPLFVISMVILFRNLQTNK